MFFRVLQIVCIGVLLTGCPANPSSMEKASANYKNTKDVKSLERLYKHLSKEMPRKEVERLLGEADYSPTQGQYYYASTYSEVLNQNSVIGLVVDYRNDTGTVTETLQVFWLGPIGE